MAQSEDSTLKETHLMLVYVCAPGDIDFIRKETGERTVEGRGGGGEGWGTHGKTRSASVAVAVCTIDSIWGVALSRCRRVSRSDSKRQVGLTRIDHPARLRVPSPLVRREKAQSI